MQYMEYLDYSIYTNKMASYQSHLIQIAEKPQSNRMLA